MSDDEEMPPAVCEVCEPHALAVMYVDVEPPIGSSVPHDAMYVCAPCLLRVREVVGQCGHAFSKPDDEPPDTVHVVYLEIDGAELESWAVCPTHAKRISELKRIPTPPKSQDVAAEAVALKHRLLQLAFTASSRGVAAVGLLEATAQLICESTPAGDRPGAKALMLKRDRVDVRREREADAVVNPSTVPPQCAPTSICAFVHTFHGAAFLVFFSGMVLGGMFYSWLSKPRRCRRCGEPYAP